MAELKALLETKDVNSILAYFHTQTPANVKRIATRVLNVLLDLGAYAETESVWVAANIDPLKISTVDWGVLSTRYLIGVHRVEDAVRVYECLYSLDQTRKRLLLLLMCEFIRTKKYERCVAFYFSYMITKYVVESSDLELFLTMPHQYYQPILKTLCKLPLIINPPVDQHVHPVFAPPKCPDGGELTLIAFTEQESKEMIALVHEVLLQSKTQVLFNSYPPTFVLDGANILYYGERAITINSYKRIDTVIRELLHRGATVQLVLHVRHFKRRNDWSASDQQRMQQYINKWRQTIQVYETPQGANDDWFAIASAIQSNSYIITNDKFRDHICSLAPYSKRFNLDLFAQWCKEYVLHYEMTQNNETVQIFSASKWTERIQESSSSFYIPMTTGNWIQIPKIVY